MKERIKAAAELLSSYNTVIKQKQIIDEQMFSIFELYRNMIREEQSMTDKDMYDSCKNDLRKRLCLLQSRHNELFLKQRLINSLLDRIPLTEKTVLRRFYISGGGHGAAEELMELLTFEKTHIYRLKDRGLSRIGQMMEALSDLDGLKEDTDEDA